MAKKKNARRKNNTKLIPKKSDQMPGQLTASQKQDSSIMLRHEMSFEGPLPPPEILSHYEDITPGLADRIVALAENEAKHRHEMDANIVHAGVENQKQQIAIIKRGQFFGFGALTLFSILGILVAIYKNVWIGSGLSLTGLVPIVWAFRYDKRKPDQKSKDKKDSED